MDDDKKPAPEAEDAVMQQSYPSPIVDSAEAQYYEQLAQHRELDPQMEHQPAQPEHHGLPSLPEHQEQHEHHELHQLQGLQDSPAPQQQISRPPVSADELQLAAQLTQDLAPMMAAAVQDQAQEQQQQEPISQQHAQEGQVQPQSEPNLQEQLEASLQNHEREMQSHEHELQNHNHELQNHELQDVMPHAGQPQPHHYAQNPPPQPHLPHHMSMEHLPQPHPQYQLPDATPPRKRSKVSRACDECRRKKIKCDAQSEANEQPCSNCRRSNAHCLFSRVPQKRGPSKGYIKELADRINTIEGKLSTNVDGLERRASSEAFASPGLGDESRKRHFSSISGGDFQTPPPNKMSSSFSTDHRPILPYQQQPGFRPPNSGDPANLAPIPMAPPEYAGTTNDTNLQGQPEMMDRSSPNGLPQGSAHQPGQVPPEVTDTMFDNYLEFIHPTYPVVASTKARMQSLLWQSPPILQKAFYNAFSFMVKPFFIDPDAQVESGAATTLLLLNEWEAEGSSRSAVTDLVRLQILVMALISMDCTGVVSLKGQQGGPSKTEILTRAAGIGYSMKLFSRPVPLNPDPEMDLNSDENVALRTWWVLVMLDRWNAIGMATPPTINDYSVVVQPGLKHIVGEVVFVLIRLSIALEGVVPFIVNLTIDPSPFSLSSTAASSMLRRYTEMINWVFPTDRTDGVLHLAYWHLMLVSELVSSDRMQRPSTILRATGMMVDLLREKCPWPGPLTHHFSALAAVGLAELYRLEGTREDAMKLAQDLFAYCCMSQSPWHAAVREKVRRYQDAPPPGTAGQNLQQLADLATAVDGEGAAGTGAAAVGDGQAPKEGTLAAGVNNGNGTSSLGEPGAAKPESDQEVGAGAAGDGTQAPVVGVDVRALLREGYLNWFAEPEVM